MCYTLLGKKILKLNFGLRGVVSILRVPKLLPMKKILLSFIIMLACLTAIAQTSSIDSTNTNVVVYPNNFKLYKTQNMWMFLKLDTRNGKIWQVQYHTDSKKRFDDILNIYSLNNDNKEVSGRFELHETSNIYNFILIDKLDGRTWQVQWGSPDDRGIFPIR